VDPRYATKRALLPALLPALVCGLLLAACGGGGGGTSEPDSGPPAIGTGLVPAAPTPGATLYDDAMVLRPLQDGAVWAYRGVRTSAGLATPYAASRSLAAQGAGFIEATYIDNGEPSQLGVRVSGDRIVITESLTGLPSTGQLEYDELSSPVRINQQTVLLDRAAVDIGEDLDGDRTNDTADIAGYRRVIGNEDVALPELSRSVLALRVDTTLLLRVRLSSQPAPEAVLSVLVSTWYAPGIGIVREQVIEPGVGNVPSQTSDERLQYWSTANGGLGLVPSVRVAQPGGLPSLGPWLRFPYSAKAVGDVVFVLTNLDASSPQPDLGVVVSVLDRNGRAQSSVEHRSLGFNANARPEWLALSDGMALAKVEPGAYVDPYATENLRLLKFDASGQLAATPLLVQGALPRTLVAAADGAGVWVSWADRVLPFGPYRVLVQRFAADGTALWAPQVLDSRTDRLPDFTSIAATSGRALVTWRVPYFLGDGHWQALVSDSGVLSAPAPLIAVANNSGGGEPGRPTPWVSPLLAALTWYRSIEPSPFVPQPPLRGVALNADASVRRSTAGAIDSEELSVPAHDAFAAALAIDGDSLLWIGAGTAILGPAELSLEPYLELRTWTPGAVALGSAVPKVQRWRNRSPSQFLGALTNVSLIVPMSDRLLFIGHDGYGLTAAVGYRD
jgi:hypothetical protein